MDTTNDKQHDSSGNSPSTSRTKSAGIVPVDASALSAFLDDHREAPGFELTYADDGIERTQLLHDVSLRAVTMERPSAAPAIECTPVAAGADQFTVRVDDVELLTVVEPPPDLYTADAETPAEKATAFRRLADVNPNAVPIPSLVALLDGSDEQQPWQCDALQALEKTATARPDACTPAVPVLGSLLASDALSSPPDAIAALRMIGTENPAEIAHLTDELIPHLYSKLVPARTESARCLAEIAEDYPEDAVAAVPALATIVEDGIRGQRYAVYALSRVAREYPEAVKQAAEPLAEVLLDDSLADGMRLNATAALGRVIGEYPAVGVDLVDDMVELFDAQNHKLRNNAIALVGDVAVVHTDVVEPFVDDVAALLTVEDTFTRINASGALSRVARDFPESVEPLTETFVALLADEEAPVRENACWALGHLRADTARDALREVRDDATDEAVRERAVWAISRIDSTTGGHQ